MGYDPEAWQRTVFEALRPIDPPALFHVSLLEMDFRDVMGHELADFPAGDLVAFVDKWLESCDPDAGVFRSEWQGGGVRLVLRAKGRGPSWRGWTGTPSLSYLEPEMGDLHLVSGGRRRLIDLSLDEVDQLASGDLRVVGQGPSYQETFVTLADQMRYFDWKSVADMPREVITTFATMLGLVEAQPGLGNYDAGWSELHRERPDS